MKTICITAQATCYLTKNIRVTNSDYEMLTHDEITIDEILAKIPQIEKAKTEAQKELINNVDLTKDTDWDFSLTDSEGRLIVPVF